MILVSLIVMNLQKTITTSAASLSSTELFIFVLVHSHNSLASLFLAEDSSYFQ